MNTRSKLIVTCVLVALAGCVSTLPPSQSLVEAQDAYDRAKSNPEVLRYASDRLEQAEQTLQQAWAAGEPIDMDSLAYIANNQVQIAEAIARQEVAEARIVELSAARTRVQLESRDAELSALRAEMTERGAVVTLGNVLFVTGKSDLLPGAQSTVDRLARYLTEYREKTVLIEGHTDSTGTDAINLRLSQDRAESVRLALISRGIDPSRITATGLGSSRPVASNATAEGRQQNRRVEIVIQE